MSLRSAQTMFKSISNTNNMQRLTQLLLFMCLALLPTQGWGATAHVQDAHTRDNSGASVSTVAVTMAGATTATNLMACGVYWADTARSLSSISDGTNGSYTLVSNPTTGGLFRAAMGYFANSGGATLTVTATFDSAFTAQKLIVCHEASGVATSTPLDTSAMSDLGAIGGGTDNITFNLTLGTSGDYIFGFFVNYSQNGAVTPGTGYTVGEQFASSTGTSEYLANFAGTGTKAVTATDGSFDTHLAGAMAFKPAAGAAASVPSLMLMGVGQ